MEQRSRYLIYATLFSLSSAAVIVPNDENPQVWANEGDLTLGYLSQVFRPSTAGEEKSLCSSSYVIQSMLHSVETVAMAIEDVNRQNDVLPNITLGFVAVDTCHLGHIAMARATYLLPDRKARLAENKCHLSENMSDVNDADRQSLINQRHYEVQGVIGPAFSHQAVKVAALFSAFQIPIVSDAATHDALSDKSDFEYFLRVSPPDRFVAAGIVDIILHYNWTYVIVLHTEGDYSESLSKVTEKLLKKTEVCVAFSQLMLNDADDSDFDLLANKIYNHREARVIVDFAGNQRSFPILQRLGEKGLKHHFFLISTENYMFARNDPLVEYANGAIFLAAKEVPLLQFLDYFEKRTPWSDPPSPWLAGLWETGFGCSWANNSEADVNSCYNYTQIERMEGYREPNLRFLMSKVYDAVLVFANGLHNLISEHCPESFVRPELARHCVKGPLLLNYLRKTDIDGVSGRITFDANGDYLAKYNVFQLRKEAGSGRFDNFVVGEYDMLADTKLELSDVISWSMFDDARIDDELAVFESVCSRPCAPRHVFRPGELPCCWTCQKCRSNEIMTNNRTTCESCPSRHWPDNDTSTSCHEVDETYLRWDSPLGSCLVVLACFGAIGSIIVLVVFSVYQEHKLVRATSRSLSNMILIGTLLGSFDVLLFVIKPTNVVCVVRRVLFHGSVALLYAPMLVKTTRIYRIFSGAKKGKQKIRYVSNSLQNVISFSLFALQVMFLIIAEIIFPTAATPRQPILLEKYTEIFCEQNLGGFILPLSYNILIVGVCAVFGYLTRKLPENFNESRHIFVMVNTTLFMWVVLLPTYFTTFYAYYQAFLLALCLLLTVGITLGCLFFPRVYAVYFVSTDKMTFITMATSSSISGSSSSAT